MVLDPRVRTAGWTAAAAGLLLGAAPSPATAVAQLSSTPAGPDPAAPLVAAATLGAWGLAGWLAVTVLVTVAGSRPGRGGQLAGVLARRVAPAAVRRAVEVSFGLTVVVGTLGLSTAASAATPAPPVAGSTAAVGLDGTKPLRLDWPTSAALDAAAAPAASASDDTGTAPGTPASSTPTPLPPPVPTPAVTAAPVTAAPAPAPSVTAQPVPAVDRAAPDGVTRPPTAGAVPLAATTSPAATGAAVVVRPGDSLWAVARRDLQAAGAPATVRDVAAAWPRWWTANREAVGDDPDFLRPGTHLTPPTR